MRDLYRIISGITHLRFKTAEVFICPLTSEQKYLAEIFGDDMYDAALQSGCLLQEEVDELLLNNRLWSLREETILEKIPKDVEELKYQYFIQFYNPPAKLMIKSKIKELDEWYGELLNKKYLYSDATCEGIRTSAVNDYTILHSTFTGKMPYDFKEVSPRAVLTKYVRSVLNSDDIRQISRCDRWRSIWSSSKLPSALFTNVDMTDMQLSLISWSRVYDNIYESMDAPSEDVIKDDLAIDGWFIAQARKRDGERKKRDGEKLTDKYKNAGEIFVQTSNNEHAKTIHELNTSEAKGKMKSRYNDLDQHGSLQEQDFATVKRDIQMEATRLTFANRKGK